MKYEWEMKDLIVGRRIKHRDHDQGGERHMICWYGHCKDQRYGLVAGTDGMVQLYDTKQDLLKRLNDGEYVPLGDNPGDRPPLTSGHDPAAFTNNHRDKQ